MERVRDVWALRKESVNGRFVSCSLVQKSHTKRIWLELTCWYTRTKLQRGQLLQRHATAGAQQSMCGHGSKTRKCFCICVSFLKTFFCFSLYEAYNLITIMLIICSSFRTKSTFFCVVSEARTALWLLQASLALSYESFAVMNFKQELPTRCQLSPHTFSGMETTGACVLSTVHMVN